MRTFDLRSKSLPSVLKDAAGLARNLYLDRRYPVSLIQFVTNRCNARCDFCFIDFDDPDINKDELTLDEIDRLSRTMGPHLKNVNLTGGEPFSRKDLLAIARIWFGNTEIESIFITCNGSLPDRVENFTRRLSAEFPDRQILFSLSIDALDKAHDDIRKLPKLFANCLRTYHMLRDMGNAGANVTANIAITVSPNNYTSALETYEALTSEHGVTAMTCTAVREAGVFKLPHEQKQGILDAYRALTKRIRDDLASGRLEGYDRATALGRMMNRKNDMMTGIIADIYMDHQFVTPCQAGSLLAVMAADGTVSPCEVLSWPLGNVRDFDLDFMALWGSDETKRLRKWRDETKCTCTYECAWSYNILGSPKYLPALLKAALTR
jgi:radical SAM protein with 4Fe4S-binding SPASM domain